jgi:hypothetical protein
MCGRSPEEKEETLEQVALIMKKAMEAMGLALHRNWWKFYFGFAECAGAATSC